jgi:hypothetical protein
MIDGCDSAIKAAVGREGFCGGKEGYCGEREGYCGVREGYCGG